MSRMFAITRDMPTMKETSELSGRGDSDMEEEAELYILRSRLQDLVTSGKSADSVSQTSNTAMQTSTVVNGQAGGGTVEQVDSEIRKILEYQILLFQIEMVGLRIKLIKLKRLSKVVTVLIQLTVILTVGLVTIVFPKAYSIAVTEIDPETLDRYMLVAMSLLTLSIYVMMAYHIEAILVEDKDSATTPYVFHAGSRESKRKWSALERVFWPIGLIRIRLNRKRGG